MRLTKPLILTLACAAIGVSITSCGGQKAKIADEYFSDDCIVWAGNDVAEHDTLRAESVSTEVLGAYKLNVVDTVVCVSTRATDTMFELRTLQGDSIATVGLRGPGPNDFTSNRTCGQLFSENGEFGLWVVDVNSAKMKRLNISRSLSQGQNVVDSVVQLRPMVSDAFLSGDKLYQITMSEKNLNLRVTNATEGNGTATLSEDPLYKLEFDSSKLFMTYNASVGMTPDGKYLVMAMLAFNQINIMDLTDMSRKSIVVGESTPSDKLLDEQTMTPQQSYYKAIALSNDYIFALYENQPFSSTDYKPTVLHIAKPDGTLVAVAPLDRYISSIAYSPQSKKIYGLSENGELCIYNVSELFD
jgi:WD40 repeat protein